MVLSFRTLKRPSKSRSPRPNVQRSASARSTLSEALRNSPFRPPSSESIVLEEDVDDGVKEINDALIRLAESFPDVKIEVIREILNRFDGESRLEISAEQLYKYKAEWARGRLQVPPREPGEKITAEDLFRTDEYINSVKKALGLEFKALSKSAIDAVLAEVNNSYSRARPILQGLAAKSWRYAISNFFKKRPQDDVPLVLFANKRFDSIDPALVPTESAELDLELRNLFIKPLQVINHTSLESDYQYALKINHHEAENTGALYECQCCYSEVTFEELSCCDKHTHFVCFDCIRRTMNEALFGQGWSKAVDITKMSLLCLASASEPCHGTLPSSTVQRAISTSKTGHETWSKFESRIATQSLQNSALPLLYCPFCTYAEAENIISPSDVTSRLVWHLRQPAWLFFLVFVTLLPFLLLLAFLTSLTGHNRNSNPYHTLKSLLTASLTAIALSSRPTRFRCLQPTCLRSSCLTCKKPWHDPHICHEPLLLSLRTSVEAARTAAVKRTCPRCGTGFVKASGCNKLTCVCGYSMCYLCRKALTRSAAGAGAAANAAGGVNAAAAGDGEGYQHFCPHFRPVPGRPCTECQKCDLYRNEDEDMVVRKAGEEAERQWRVREGMVGVEGLEDAVSRVMNIASDDSVSGILRRGEWVERMIVRFVWGEWTVQELVTALVRRCVVVRER